MKYPMTVEGVEKLRTELKDLLDGRAAISRAIGEARQLGDLKENADYHAAKERQGLAEARIRYLEERLSHSNVIDVTKLDNDGRVIFGATVTLVELDSGTKVKYRIVGEDESDIKAGLISNVSPLARAMIGQKLGEIFTVGDGEHAKDWEIKTVDYL